MLILRLDLFRNYAFQRQFLICFRWRQVKRQYVKIFLTINQNSKTALLQQIYCNPKIKNCSSSPSLQIISAWRRDRADKSVVLTAIAIDMV